VNPFEFVLTLIVIVFAFRIISHRMGMRTGWDRRWANKQLEAGDPRETDHLRDEVKELKERIQVLERITVDKENSLAKEIESLRDR
jgi:cell division protein FtsB